MKIVASMVLFLATTVLAIASEPMTKEAVKAEVQEAKAKVNDACAEDAAKAGCTGDSATIGKGLMKCLKAYKKEHKDFKISDSCKMASKEMKHKRHELKQLRQEVQNQKTEEVKK